MKTPSKKPRQRAPEWIIWEEFILTFDDMLRNYMEDCHLEYLDHTDTCLVLTSWSVLAPQDQELLSETIPKFGIGFSEFFYAHQPGHTWIMHPRFYQGRKWRTCRYATLLQQGNWCRCCGRRPPDVELHVDHIEPRSLAPERAWDLSNLQVLCRDCNLGKGNGAVVDWRGAKALTT